MIRRVVAYVRKFDRNLWVLSLGWFVSSLGFAASIPFIAIYFSEAYGMSLGQIGLFFGAMAVVRSVFQAIGGEVSDRIERRRLLIWSQIFRSAAFLLMAVAIALKLSIWWTGSFLLVNSIFGAIFQPVANAVVSDFLPTDRRIYGYAITRSAGNLGWAVGPAIGGFMAKSSYALLFYISAGATLASALIFLFFLANLKTVTATDRFRFKDIIAITKDRYLAIHCFLMFLLYLVVAQLMAPFSLYTVRMVGISEAQLGWLYTLNGLLVVGLQLPVTRLLAPRLKFTTQLALGAFLYALGYGMIGIFVGLPYFVLAVIVVTTGEVFMSPPALALTARLAPEGRIGRYMGTFGFFQASGWSFGPLYGGLILDRFGSMPALAWVLISSLALVSGVGFLIFQRRLPEHFNRKA